MKNQILRQVAEYLKARRLRKKWQVIITCLAAAVVFCTTYALILPAITLEKSAVYCGYEEHQHTDDCYTQELICGLEEGEGHTHTEGCYDEDQNLICGLEETDGHVHTDDCYGELVLNCGYEEEHVHNQECYSNPDADGETDGDEETDANIEKTADQEGDTPEESLTDIEGYAEDGETWGYNEDGSIWWTDCTVDTVTEVQENTAYVIGGYFGKSFMIGAEYPSNENTFIKATPKPENKTVFESYQVWYFEKDATTNTYYMYVESGDVSRKYLRMDDSDTTSNNRKLYLVDKKDNATLFTVEKEDDTHIKIGKTINGTTYYLNTSGGDSTNCKYFQGWYRSEQGSWLQVGKAQAIHTASPLKTATSTSTTINLFDYWINSNGDPTAPDTTDDFNSGINSGEKFKFSKDNYGTWGAMNCGTSSKNVVQGIVQDKLVKGYPVLSGDSVLTKGDTSSLDYLFDPTVPHAGKASYANVGGLLRVDSQGYFYYNSHETMAEYDANNENIIVYDQPGVYPSSSSNTLGEFFPFNKAPQVAAMNANSGLMNHYVGLTITTRFMLGYEGHTDANKRTPTTFEFSGDDDVWIFIDDVLVADLGGRHTECSVSIDFSTGDIKIDAGNREYTGEYGNNDKFTDAKYTTSTIANTTLKDVFTKVEASPANGGWRKNTFEDYTAHTLKFFYLERGNYDSNLKLRYNLKEIPDTAIYKVDQYGDPVPGATFSVYKADENYNMLSGEAVYTGTTDEKGQMVFVNSDGMPYTLSELKDMFGEYFILKETAVPDGYRMVSDEIHLRIVNNQVLVCDNPYESGTHAAPDLLVNAPDKIMLVTNVNELLNDSYVGTATAMDNTVRTTIQYFDPDTHTPNGTVFAVVLKYTGPESVNDLRKKEYWSPVYGTNIQGFTAVNVKEDFNGDFVRAAIDTAKRYVESDNVFSLASSGQMQGKLEGIPGDIMNYYYMLDNSHKTDTQYTVAYYWTSADSLDNATSSNTYRIDADKDTAGESYAFDRQFGATIAVPNLQNVLFVQKFDEDGNAVNGAEFAMYEVQEKPNDDTSGNKTTIYYIGKDEDGIETCIYLAPDTDGDNAGEAKIGDDHTAGTYKIDPETANITVSTSDGATYTIEAKKYAERENVEGKSAITETADRTGDRKIGQDGTGYFINMLDGTYYVREITAPKGYSLNTTEVMVLVDDTAVYANAGTAKDNVTVARGSGYVVSSMAQFASKGDIDNTLTWVYEMMRVSGESTSFADSDFSAGNTPQWGYLITNGNGEKDSITSSNANPHNADDALRIYLEYDNIANNALFNYKVNSDRYKAMEYSEEDIKNIQRRLYTNVGWGYYELYQDFRWGLGYKEGDIEAHKNESANYNILTDNGTEEGTLLEIANLFSRATYIQVTDDKVSNLEISKTVVNKTLEANEKDDTSFEFTVNLYKEYVEKTDEPKTDEGGNPIMVPVPLEGSYPYTVYDVTYDEDGNVSGRNVATQVIEGQEVPVTGTISNGGTIKLTDKQVVVIENLPHDAFYTVTETEAKDYTTTYVVDGEESNSGFQASGKLVWKVDESEGFNDTVTVAYTNIRILPVDLTIRKVDAFDTTKTLPDAAFTIQREVTEDGQTLTYCYTADGSWKPAGADVISEILTTGTNGEIVIKELTDGKYTLTETKAPEGYQLIKTPIIFTVKNGIATASSGNNLVRDEEAGEKANAYILTVANSTGYILPDTGGEGTYFYIFSGLLLMAGAVMCGYILRRKGERREKA